MLVMSKLFQTEGSPISIVLTSIVEGQEIAFIPVVIQQVYHQEFDKELILYGSSEVLYSVSIQGGGSHFGITLFPQPESFLWLTHESAQWNGIQQQWIGAAKENG